MSQFSGKVEPIDVMFIRVSKADIGSGEINPTLQQLNRLIANKATILKYRDVLSFDIDGYEDNPKALFEIRDVQNFMKKLDKEFAYWFYFLSKSDSTLEFIFFSICNHYRESASGEWRVQREIYWKFMSEHFAALERILDLAEVDEQEREWLRDEIKTYFERVNNMSYYESET